MFGADLVIKNLEVDLVALQSEAVNSGVVGCNDILLLLGIESGINDCVEVKTVGGQDAMITAASSDG